MLRQVLACQRTCSGARSAHRPRMKRESLPFRPSALGFTSQSGRARCHTRAKIPPLRRPRANRPTSKLLRRTLLEHRIGDRRVIRLIRKWLNAGVIESGSWADTGMGTPQGAIVSPVLANVFLHYVLDLWFHKKWRPNVPDGEAIIVRYADDIVVGFQHKRDAERYLRDVRERLARFGLSLHQDKTRLVEFGRFADLNRRQRGVGKPETFDFLGLTHYCTTTLRGRFRLGRKPVAKRVNRTLARIDEVLRKRWHHDIWEVGRWLGRVCNGWLNYFAVPGSGRFIRAVLRRLQRRWMRALRRRSQRARFSWKRLERMTEILWPRASIRHPWPDQRFAVKHPR